MANYIYKIHVNCIHITQVIKIYFEVHLNIEFFTSFVPELLVVSTIGTH